MSYCSSNPLPVILTFVTSLSLAADAEQPARVVSYYGYEDCIRLENSKTQVTLCPAAGGRVLEFSLTGVNALYLPEGDEGWTAEKGGRGRMNAGRFDIGPEQTIARHPALWEGRWRGEIVSSHSARLTSQVDEATGVQLIREFELSKVSAELSCTQIIKNVSKETKEYCHWSRTFAHGDGICVIPLSQPSRFPHSYVMYGPGTVINFRPEDPNIRIRDGFLEIMSAPQFPKLGMDSLAGWFAYQMKNDVLFIKKFKTYPDRVYNEVAGLTISIWYPDRPMCELEPIGPRERLEPGGSSSFTEKWILVHNPYPAKGVDLDLDRVRELAK